MKNYFLFIFILFLVTFNLYSQEEKKYILLSSGEDNKEPTEVYAVTEAQISKLPECNPLKEDLPLSAENAIKIAEKYMKRRYPDLKFVFGSINLSRFTNSKNYYSSGKAKDWCYLVFFEYNEEGYSQAVPVLLDGTVVYSGNESFKETKITQP